MLRLCYYHPAHTHPGAYYPTTITSDMDEFDNWVHYMVAKQPDAIFFLVQVTTDIDFP